MRARMVAATLWMLALGASAELSAQQCNNAEPVGSLGVSLVECDCVIAPATTRTQWEFRSEPRIRKIEPGSAAAGVLQIDDVILSINGNRLTTAAGARALSSLTPGEQVTVTVLRNGVVRTEILRPTSVCPNDPTLLGAAPAVQRVRVAGAVVEAQPTTAAGARPRGGAAGAAVAGEQGQRSGGAAGGGQAGGGGRAVTAQARAGGRGGAPVPSGAPFTTGFTQAPRAWIGVAFSCTDCTVRNGVWSFTNAPEMYSVEPGSPAYEAGLRRGDVLTHINDVAITSEEGGRLWAQVKPGDQLRLRYRRGETVRNANVEAVAPRGVALRSTQLRTIESALARDTVRFQQLEQNARAIQESYARVQGRQRLTQEQTQQQIAQLQELHQQYARTQSPEDRRRYEELLAALARSQAQQNATQDEQLTALIRANRVNAERLAATQDSIERAVVTLRAMQATAGTGEQRLRYSGSFAGTDIEVRGVSPVVVSETANEITIRIGDAVVTLKRGRN